MRSGFFGREPGGYLRNEAPDPGVLGEHLHQCRVAQVAPVPCQDREGRLFLLANVSTYPPYKSRTNPG